MWGRPRVCRAPLRETMRLKPLVLVLLAGSLAGTALAGPAGVPGGRRTIQYQGLLRDEAGQGVSGVFPLSFALHRGRSGRQNVWKEDHWVAVAEGSYQLELGRRNPLPPGVDPEALYLSVALPGGREIVRERLSTERIFFSVPVESSAAPAPSGAPGGLEYVKRAERAETAEHAANAERLEGQSLADIERRVAGGPLVVGQQKRYMAPAGSGQAEKVEIVCPRGWVLTGIEGGSGILIDALSIVCQPLERVPAK